MILHPHQGHKGVIQLGLVGKLRRSADTCDDMMQYRCNMSAGNPRARIQKPKKLIVACNHDALVVTDDFYLGVTAGLPGEDFELERSAEEESKPVAS